MCDVHTARSGRTIDNPSTLMRTRRPAAMSSAIDSRDNTVTPFDVNTDDRIAVTDRSSMSGSAATSPSSESAFS